VPPLEIPGFNVRPIELRDAELWAAYACLPQVREHTSSTEATVEDIRATIQRMVVREPGSPIHFVIIPREGEDLVATVGFHSISLINWTAEITYDVSPDHWGRGIATAACRAASAWGFRVHGWHRIQATTLQSNVASQRVLERSGYQREGRVRNFRVVRGRPVDYWLYSILPQECL
jgi:[ribosomal protein S5]-alanine N-acetyltransferase